MINLQDLIRTGIRGLISCAKTKAKEDVRDSQHIMLGANENPYNKPFNRYPSDDQIELKEELAELEGVKTKEIFLNSGSTEAIDMYYRIFCQPKVDSVVAIELTCELYKHFAKLDDIEYRPVLLDEELQLNVAELLRACDKHTKLVWLCSSNAPSDNLLNVKEVEKVSKGSDDIVVIDEAYADFTHLQTFRERISEFPNIIVLNTFSKTWVGTATCLGVAYAQEAIISVSNKVGGPYHISQLTQTQGLGTLKHHYDIEDWIKIILSERKRMIFAFESLACCEKVYPSNANFFLVKMKDAQSVYDCLCEKGIHVRNCSSVSLYGDCLCIITGSEIENAEILGIFRYYKPIKQS